MVNVIQTPMDFSNVQRVGRRRFWKQLLPVAKIQYNGTEVDFNEEFHKDLELSFKDGAYDQVPLVFADADNRHNEDPRNFGGELVAVENRGEDGTWGLIEADRDAAKVIKRNPKLGVSARIVQDLEKSDGRKFPRAIRHVLLTMNPRVSGMQPWQAVDLSDEGTDIEVVDLTAVEYEEGSPMGRKASVKRNAKGQIDLSSLDDDQFMALLDLATAVAEADEDEDVDLDDLDVEDEVDEDEEAERKPRRKKSKVKTTKVVERESEDDGDEDEDDEEDEDDDESTDLSDAPVRKSERSQFQQMRIDLAARDWQTKRAGYLAAGVPPFMLDLAAPVLSQPDAMTLDLSDDESIDATKIITEILDKSKGLVDLSGEDGHQVDLSNTGDDDPDAAFLAAWDEQYG